MLLHSLVLAASLAATSGDAADLVLLRPEGELRDSDVAGRLEVRGGRLRVVACRIGGPLLATEGARLAVESSSIGGGVLVGPLADVLLVGTEAPVRRILEPAAEEASATSAEAPPGRSVDSGIDAALALLALDRPALSIPTDRLPAGTPALVRSALADPAGAAGAVEALGESIAGSAAADLLPLLAGLVGGAARPGLAAAARDEMIELLRRAALEEEADRTLLEDHLLGPEERARSSRLADLVGRSDLGPLVAEAARIVAAVARGETPAGAVVGSPGADTHVLRAAGPGDVVVVVDPGGDDRYVGAPAAAEGGVAVVVDLGGDDSYEGGDVSVAAALGGVAVLWDRAGDDRYEGGRVALGAALGGVALLLDEAGDDRYTAASLAEGAAGPGGAALLLDRAGDDLYEAAGAADEIRDPARRNSLSQGFATGARPGAAGGVGILLDAGGDDLYRAGNFAQGVGYWAGAGLLLDLGGDDRRLAHRYVQGAGVHLALGALLEAEGRDLYDGWTMAQGAGHDLAVGLLLDAAGNDLYRAHSLAQGGGSANGVGLLLEAAGDDRYAVEADHGEGVGDFEEEVRRRGSVGLLVDAAGADAYSRAAAGDERAWSAGRWGVGIDGAGAAPDPPPPLGRAVPPATVPPAAPPVSDPLDWREAFLVLSTGRASYRPLHAAARRLLAREAPASLVWAASYFDPEDPREWRSIRDAAREAGPRAGPALAAEAARRAASNETRAAIALLHALGATGDSASRPVLESLLAHADSAVRGAAAKALGDLGDAAAAGALAAACADAETAVRRLAADALGRLDAAPPPSIAALAAALSDPDAWTAVAAADALASLAARGLVEATAPPVGTALDSLPAARAPLAARVRAAATASPAAR